MWADDDEKLLVSIRAVLEPEFEVVEAVCDGPSALEATEKLEPDIVVLDVSMPKMGGIEVARQLASRPEPPAIVFLTSHKEKAIVEAALGTGALGYVHKPSAGEHLMQGIHDVLEGRRFVSPTLRE